MLSFLLSLHLISVICWFAGLFYLPRLFVYHAMTQEKAVFDQFKTMEYKLYYFIMHPALLMTLLTGAGLMIDYGLHHSETFPLFRFSDLTFWVFWLKNWLFWKLGLVFLLVIFHIRCRFYLKNFAIAKTPDEFKHSPHYKTHRFFRIFNEIPTVILILVIFLAVYKP